jgi:hypothetical protein
VVEDRELDFEGVCADNVEEASDEVEGVLSPLFTNSENFVQLNPNGFASGFFLGEFSEGLCQR